MAETKVEWLAQTDEVRVRILTLAAGEQTPWHFHSEVTDDVFCLDGRISVRSRDTPEAVSLTPGQRHRIPPGQIHSVANDAPTEARYLLVQTGGAYDFLRPDPITH